MANKTTLLTTENRTTPTSAIGPYSRPLALAKLDGRTREAALMRRVRAELTAHVGGAPTFPERVLIDRAAILALRIAQIDAKIVAGGDLTTHDNNHAIAWHNAYRRTIEALGIKHPATAIDPMETLRAHVSARQGEAA
jgi:hypothetical protein